MVQMNFTAQTPLSIPCCRERRRNPARQTPMRTRLSTRLTFDQRLIIIALVIIVPAAGHYKRRRAAGVIRQSGNL
jgi:hypothetical protein